MTWLGIDIGTSGVKAVLMSAAGAVIDEANAPLDVARPRPGWSEQDPEDWWRAAIRAVGLLDAKARRAVRGIGLTGQMHGAVVLGTDGAVLRPAILWNDNRATGQCARLDGEARTRTGNPSLPGFTAPKLMWLREREPVLFAQIRRVLLPKDHLRLRLTGEYATDMSDASGTLWLDVANRRWSDAMLEASGMDRDRMPRLLEGTAVSGTLLPAVAGELGLPPGVPVAAGGGDQAAGAVGVGAVRNDAAFVSLGTSGVVFSASRRFDADADRAVHAFCHALPGLWHRMSVTLTAGGALEWVARATGHDDAATAIATAAEPADDDPLFLPHLAGERTPLNDPDARGAFVGLSLSHGRETLVAAALEGVAFALRDGLDALDLAPGPLMVVGGGVRSAAWLQRLADALARPLNLCEGAAVGPAFGGARLARLAVEGGDPAETCPPPPLVAAFEPSPRTAARTAHRLSRFRAATAALASIRTPA